MTLCDAVSEFLLYLSSVRSLSVNTVTGYKNDLAKLLSYLGEETDITKITSENLNTCIGALSKNHSSAATINRFIAAVRSLFAYCRKFDYILNNPSLEIKTVRLPKKVPAFMTEAEVDTLCSQPQKNELLWASRDRAIFEMLYSSGCRISEIAGLKLNDFLNGFSSAIVRGKGSKERIVYFEADAQKSLSEYLLDRKNKLAELNITQGVPALFINQKGAPLSAGGIRWILSRYSGAEGTNHHINPHAFRHTFATQMIAGGADVRLVQEMLGHSSISTTQRYTHVTTEQLIETYRKAHPHGSN